MKLFFISHIILLFFLLPVHGQKNIVFLVGERFNRSSQTMPSLAVSIEDKFKHKTYYINIPKNGSAENINLIEKADLLFIYIQHRNLPQSQINQINKHIEAGKPVIAFNSTSQAFEKQSSWFPRYFGGGYRGKVNEKGPSLVTVLPENREHPILKGLSKKSFYISSKTTIPGPLAKNSTPLLMGKSGKSPSFPVAWAFSYRKNQKIFYTSLGTADDFSKPIFQTIIFNAIEWCLSDEKSFKSSKGPKVPDPPAINAPANAKILFNGSDMNNWRHWDLLQSPVSLKIEEQFLKFANIQNKTKPNWKIQNNSLLTAPGKGDLISKENFGNYVMSLDFLIPEEPDFIPEEFRSSGGIFISGRYEIRIGSGNKRSNSGPFSIYTFRPPDFEVDAKPGVWHNMKIHYNHKNKGPAVISMSVNGRQLHGNIKLHKPTPYGIINPISKENPTDQSLHTVSKEFTGEKLPMGDNHFTVATRFRTTSNTGTLFARTSQITGWERDGKAFFLGNGELYYDIGWRAIIRTGRKVNDGKWHHAVLCYDRDICTVYVDGEVAFIKKKFSRPDPEGHVFKIGYEFKNFYRPFQGEISNVRYFDKALSYEEIMALTEKNIPPVKPVLDWKPDPDKKPAEIVEDKNSILKGPIRLHGDFSRIRYANIWIREN